ncbi:hypothetical protein Tco_1388400, partial [Tanacetum coccineum]
TDDDEETDDEFVHGDEYVHDDVDEEMEDAEVVEAGKDSEEITYAEKTDVEKIKVTNSDLEQAGKLLLISSSLSVSSGFDTEINSPLDIQIQQEIKQEQEAKKKMPKFSATPYHQAAEAEFKQKDNLFKMIREFKSYEKHLKHKALYDALMLSLIQDEDDLDRVVPNLRKRDLNENEDPFAGSNQGKRKRSSRKESEPSKTSSTSKKTSKGDTLPKSSKTCKFMSAEESVKEATHEVTMGEVEPVQENVNDADQPQDDESWFNNLLSAQKDPLTFNKLMATPIDFSNFEMNRLKINKITKAHLVGPVYNLLKGTCQSSIELEYNMEECYKAISDHLDWNNPKGDQFLKSSEPEKKYTTSVTKTKDARYESQLNRFLKHDVFSHLKVLSVKSVTVNKLPGYSYLEEIMVRRADRQLYKFKEGDFVNLHLNDIEDMLLFVVQHKLFHLDGKVIVDLAVALCMFTRSLIINKRVEDVKLGVESYQKKLNITKPQKDFPRISAKELYTPSFDPPGVFYEDLSNQKRLM